MLVAQNEEGKFLSLSSLNLQKEELLELRQRKKFFCPVCYEEVIIKLGTKQAWHFAHKRKLSCIDEMEGETTYHIEGKKLLFNWLKNQELDVELEPYLKEVKQRPDLLVRTSKSLL
ncbi:hypothetical protein H1D32_23445 [Anaerobacillus sp. CMMVII]|nr:competence protein CoiA [Anaerobacillus sp. CMMVII]MCT8140391.1 hypothetical protein [Anaerobacillus sp. CMMVII]